MTFVHPNQIWLDNDSRQKGRSLRIIRTDETHALCEVLTNSPNAQRLIDNQQPRSHYVPRDMRGKTARIALKRFKPTSTGYRLATPPAAAIRDELTGQDTAATDAAQGDEDA